mmetsp:Transcript_61485/g.132241  ORF Transcript_61485/g.132241 Transcript_61485/m.132241 type:complete len:272 (+) Transcript_61485:430-1245(+)
MHNIFWEPILKHAVDHAGKLRVQSLITRDELVGEGQARQEAPLLQPVDSAEGAAEKNALHCGEGDDALSEAVLAIHPLHSPCRLLLDRRHGRDGVEDGVLLNRIPDVLLDQERVGLRMNILHGHLKTIEGTSLRQLNLGGKARGQVLKDDAIGSGEEGQNVLEKVLLSIGKLIPVLVILREVDLLCCPEGSLMLLIHLPDLMVVNGKHHPPLWVLLQERVVLLELNELCRDSAHWSYRGRCWRSYLLCRQDLLQGGDELKLVVRCDEAVLT